MTAVTLHLVNETSLMVYFDNNIGPDTSEKVRRGCLVIRQQLSQYLLDLVPSYHSVLVVFDPASISGASLAAAIEQALQAAPLLDGSAPKNRLTIPVYYGPEVGWDIEDVATRCALSVAEVIQRHSQKVYHVLAVGFSPGFGYLGETDRQLALPRRATPRLKIPAGSVALSDRQTAVYPSHSPGGWHVIGRTPMTMFDWQQSPPAKLSVGDEVNFEPISRETFLALGGRINDA